MAVPEFVTPLNDNVIISVYGDGIGFGINGASLNTSVGTVYKIGTNVTRVYGGDRVGFIKTQTFFATVLGEVFIVVPQDDILITYAP